MAGVQDVEFRWLQDYLSDHYQWVKCGSVFRFDSIPQGSALGLLLLQLEDLCYSF